MLFIVVEASGNHVFEEHTPTFIALRARVVSYVLRASKVFVERVVVYTSEGTDWIGNQNFYCPFEESK